MSLRNSVRIRAAKPSDKVAIVQICQHTWDNEDDYIPAVWDKWIADPCGHMLIADLNGHPVGMTRLVQLSPTEGWWEGLRVDCSSRFQGIGSRLAEATLKQAQLMRLATLRTCIHQSNTLMHSFVQRRGYNAIGDYGLYRATSLPQQPSVLQCLNLNDLNLIWSTLDQFDSRSLSRLFVCQGAKWQSLTQDALSQRLKQGWVWGDRSDKLHSLFIRSHMDAPDGTFWFGWIGGKAARLVTTLQDVRCLAHQLGFQFVGGFLPQTNSLIASLSKADYDSLPSSIFEVYEKDFQHLDD